jgi:hypothetical protein
MDALGKINIGHVVRHQWRSHVFFYGGGLVIKIAAPNRKLQTLKITHNYLLNYLLNFTFMNNLKLLSSKGNFFSFKISSLMPILPPLRLRRPGRAHHTPCLP